MFYGVAGAVIGGTALMGGSGTVLGTFIGVAVLTVLNNGFTLIGVDAFYNDLFIGTAILLSMALGYVIARMRGKPDERRARDVQPDGAPDDVLRVEHVAKSFGPVTALRDVSMQLRKGEVLGLIGDNGAGKSTLVKILSGFHQPDAGEISVFGEEVHAEIGHPRALARASTPSTRTSRSCPDSRSSTTCS